MDYRTISKFHRTLLLSLLFLGCYTHVPQTYIAQPIVRAFELFPEIFLLYVLATAPLTLDDVDDEEGIG